MKHARPPKRSLPIRILAIIIVILLVISLIFGMVYSLVKYSNSGLPGYKEKPYFSVEPWTIGVELVTEEPELTYPRYFEY